MRVAATGVQRLRNLAKSTLLQVAEPKLKPKAIKLLDHAGFIQPHRASMAPGVLRPGSRQGSALTSSVALASWFTVGQWEPSHGIPAAETVSYLSNGVNSTNPQN